MIKKTITMSDIARELGISTVTVSKALGDKEGVSDELKEKIKIKATELGYRYNFIAKGMKEGLTYNVGIIVAKHFITNSSAFYWVMYRYIVECLQKHNYYGILEVVTSTQENECEMPNSILDKKVDGVIVFGQFSDEYVDVLVNHDIPKVCLDFYSSRDDIDTILSDGFYGSYMITNHLISKGHKNIGFVGNITSTSSIQDRYLGYYKALLEHNLELLPQNIITDRNSDNHVYVRFELPENLPTAFVCNCDETAYNFVRFLNNIGLNVPEDVSIVGYDNHIYSTICKPPITTIDVNMKRMSAEAVEILIRKIKDERYSYGRSLINGKIIYRESVKDLTNNKK